MNEISPTPPAFAKFASGQSVSRKEDPRLLRGEGRYTDDIDLPSMAFGYVLRSPHAHGVIRDIDVRRRARSRAFWRPIRSTI